MTAHDAEAKLLRAFTNEWVLLLFRSFMSVTLGICAWFLTDMKSGQKELATQFNDFRLTNEARISKVEGEVGLLRGSVEVHRRRLEGNDTDIRSLWGRIYDIKKGSP